MNWNNKKEFAICELSVGMPGESYKSLEFDMEGIIQDSKHRGKTRIADSRVRPNYPRIEKGKLDENWRMFSAVSLEDIETIQNRYEEKYGNSIGKIRPSWIGPNLICSGIPNFSQIPVGSTLDFINGPLLEVTAQNTSCSTPGKVIASQLNLPVEEAGIFVKIANGYRGIVGIVKRPGIIFLNSKYILRTPIPFL